MRLGTGRLRNTPVRRLLFQGMQHISLTWEGILTVENQAPARVAGYIRVSQERAARNGYGLGAQERDIHRFVEYKGWNLVELFREEGVSGYKRDRPALERMLAGVKAGRFDVVVFPSIDRTGRSVKDVIEIDRAIRKHGADTVFLREGVDTSTPTGELFRNIMASLAVIVWPSVIAFAFSVIFSPLFIIIFPLFVNNDPSFIIMFLSR